MSKSVIEIEGVCPECGKLAFITVEGSGSYTDIHGDEIYGFHGTGECSECDWSGEYEDSS